MLDRLWAADCNLNKVKACQGWNSKENWETQKKNLQGREVEAGAGERQDRRGHPEASGASGANQGAETRR